MTLGKFVTNGNMWNHPYKAVDALCEDGKRRTVFLRQQADTYFSWPGRCSIKNKSVRGYISSFETDDGQTDIAFYAYQCVPGKGSKNEV